MNYRIVIAGEASRIVKTAVAADEVAVFGELKEARKALRSAAREEGRKLRKAIAKAASTRESALPVETAGGVTRSADGDAGPDFEEAPNADLLNIPPFLARQKSP